MNSSIDNQPLVMHVISSLSVGGAEMMLYRLLQHSTTTPCMVVSLTANGELAQRIRDLGIKVIEIERGSFFSSFLKLRGVIKQHKPKLIQSWLYRADLFCALIGWREKIPVMWNIRQTAIDSVKGQRHIWLTQRLNAGLSKWLPSKIVYCANAAKSSHQAIGYSKAKGKSIVINNGVDTQYYQFNEQQRLSQRQAWKVNKNELLIGMIGRFDPLKNHARFLRIVSQVVKSCPENPVKAVLVGRGINEGNAELAHIIKENSLSENVILVDQLADTMPVYCALDIHLLTSDSEGWPNVLAEAMSMGLPCVATMVGDVLDMSKDKSAVIGLGQENMFAQKVIDYVQMPDSQRKVHAEQNRQHIEQNFSLQTSVNRYDELYLSID